MIKPKFVFHYMEVAKTTSELSYCVRRKVGAILIKNGNITSFGYNGTPKGEENVCELPDGTTKPEVQHAEANCIFKLVNSTETAEGAIMFSTDEPCYQCSTKIVDAGIKVVFYKNPYRNHDGLEYLLKHGVVIFRVMSEDKKVFQHMNTEQVIQVIDNFGWI